MNLMQATMLALLALGTIAQAQESGEPRRGLAVALNHLMHSSHETMPLIILPPEDQWHLVAHILSLRGQ